MPKVRRNTLLTTLAIVLLPFSAFGSHNDADISKILQALEANRKLVVAENMGLTEDSTDFWKVYDDYRIEIGKLDLQGMQLLMEFRDHFEDLTDERANRVMSSYFKLQKQELTLKEAHIANFNSILTPKQTLRFYQIENKLDSIIQADISSVTPLVD
jgi:hypothetical protein